MRAIITHEGYNSAMFIEYHRQILEEALQSKLSPLALSIVEEANVAQDALRGQIGHDEYHFDNNAFNASYAYIEQQLYSPVAGSI